MVDQQSKPHFSSVDVYLASVPEKNRIILQEIREMIKAMVPDCTERISYQIPIFASGRYLVGFTSQKKHCSFYTMSPSLVKAMQEDLKHYNTSGSTIHFTPQKPLTKSLIKKIVTARLKEVQLS